MLVFFGCDGAAPNLGGAASLAVAEFVQQMPPGTLEDGLLRGVGSVAGTHAVVVHVRVQRIELGLFQVVGQSLPAFAHIDEEAVADANLRLAGHGGNLESPVGRGVARHLTPPAHPPAH